jgi:hypothetical protein
MCMTLMAALHPSATSKHDLWHSWMSHVLSFALCVLGAVCMVLVSAPALPPLCIILQFVAPFCRDVSGDLLPVEAAEDVRTLKSLVQRHLKHTGSEVARCAGPVHIASAQMLLLIPLPTAPASISSLHAEQQSSLHYAFLNLRRLLLSWDREVKSFKKVFPREYKWVLILDMRGTRVSSCCMWFQAYLVQSLCP